MEGIVIIGMMAIMIGFFVSGMKGQMLKNGEADRRELEAFRKKEIMAQGAKLAAEALKAEFSNELSQQKFHAAVEEAVKARMMAAGAPVPKADAPTVKGWRAQKMAQEAQAETAASPYEVKEKQETKEHAYQAAAYNRDQDFPDHREM